MSYFAAVGEEKEIGYDPEAIKLGFDTRCEKLGVKIPAGVIVAGGFMTQILINETWDDSDIDVVCAYEDMEKVASKILELNPGAYWWHRAPGKDGPPVYEIYAMMSVGLVEIIPKTKKRTYFSFFTGVPTKEDVGLESLFVDETKFSVDRIVIPNSKARIDIIGHKNFDSQNKFAFLDDFDISVCKVAYDGTDLTVRDDPVSLLFKRGTYRDDGHSRTKARVTKYIKRGFALVPE